MGALVVKSGFVFEVINLCSDSFEFQLRLAVFALGNDCFDVSVFFVGGDFERIDPNGGLSPGVVFEHGKQDLNVVDFAVLDFIGWELKGAHGGKIQLFNFQV